MWRWVTIGVVGIAVVVFGFSLMAAPSSSNVAAQAQWAAPVENLKGFAQAIAAWDWQFPTDFGAHPAFQTEWWYYTGNLSTAEGRRFGYQFTIFRRALTPQENAAASPSEWRSNQIYMAHFALTDVAGERYFHEQRFSRAGGDLAGAVSAPLYRVWLEDWSVLAQDAAAQHTQIVADAGAFAVDFTLEQTKPPALQGQNGLSAKGETAGNASYYYSLTRLSTHGTLRVGDETFTVNGATWKDHEFSTSALSANALGWDWFGLQFDDGREVMLGQIRLADGGREAAFGGLLVEADGSTRYLPHDAFTLTPRSTWTSPHTSATYPAIWDIQITLADAAPLNFTLTPLLADQELHGLGAVDYWEGAVEISGAVSGYGYAELTGYVQSMTGRF